jgi:hypothetical protein
MPLVEKEHFIGDPHGFDAQRGQLVEFLNHEIRRPVTHLG